MNIEEKVVFSIKVISQLYKRLFKWITLVISLTFLSFLIMSKIWNEDLVTNFRYSLVLIFVSFLILLYIISILLLRKEIKVIYFITNDRIIKNSYKGLIFKKYIRSELFFTEISFILSNYPVYLLIFKKFDDKNIYYKGDEKEFIYHLHENAVHYKIDIKKTKSKSLFNDILNFLISKCQLIKHPYLEKLYFSTNY
ncbi:MAG: hypothetical protein ACFE96_01670 [Candidatus Hermodarchaeota archaeon]